MSNFRPAFETYYRFRESQNAILLDNSLLDWKVHYIVATSGYE
jgi:hypothetical protein